MTLCGGPGHASRKITHRYNIHKMLSEVFYKKGVLETCAKFAGKHLCQSLFCNKVASLRLEILFKKRHWHRCFQEHFSYSTSPDDCFRIFIEEEY